MNDMNCFNFMHGLKLAGIELDRKVLSQIAYEDEAAFKSLVEISRKALSEKKQSF